MRIRNAVHVTDERAWVGFIVCEIGESLDDCLGLVGPLMPMAVGMTFVFVIFVTSGVDLRSEFGIPCGPVFELDTNMIPLLFAEFYERVDWREEVGFGIDIGV